MLVSTIAVQKNLERFPKCPFFDVPRHHFVEGKQTQIFLSFVSLGPKSIQKDTDVEFPIHREKNEHEEIVLEDQAMSEQ